MRFLKRKRRSARFIWIQHKINAFRKLPLKKKILLIALLTFGVLFVIGAITWVIFASTLSSKEDIMNRNKTGVTLLDRNDRVFYQFYNARSDTHVKLVDISEVTKKALIASEDKDFYEHPGFSLAGIANAVYQNIIPQGNDRGGSTITQQLVKNALLSTDRSLIRKYQELILSIEIERRYSKDEILEMYLNSVYFGEGAFGIEDAAKTYFNKTAKELSLAEASMLIGVLPAPSAYSPISGNATYAKQRQATVLRLMKEDGYISQTDLTEAKAQELSYSANASEKNTKAPHFALMVKDFLEQKYGEETIARSGYKVKTTLNLDWQDRAQAVVSEQVSRLSYANASNGSVVVIDPKTGEVNALVGSVDWSNQEFGKVNMATATRQPGSSFKPFVYGTGIEEGTLTSATILHDKLTDFGGGYKPQNYSGTFKGDVSVRRSLANSLNVPAVEAMQMVGISDVINTAKQLGISTLDKPASDYGLSLALGSGQARLTELTNAYATLANQGKRNDIQLILSIKDKSDKEIFKSKSKTVNAISAQTAYILSSILSDNAARAETFGSSLSLWGNRPAAVKTGTTEDYRDALTVGYTPSLAIGVWVGNSDNTPMTSIAGSIGSGPIWRQLMQEFLGNSNWEQFQQPSGVVALQVCYGKEAIAETSGNNTYTEYFRASKIPTEKCNAAPKQEEKSQNSQGNKPDSTKDKKNTTDQTTEPPAEDNNGTDPSTSTDPPAEDETGTEEPITTDPELPTTPTTPVNP